MVSFPFLVLVLKFYFNFNLFQVWSLDTLKCIASLGPMNHWVRALHTSENFLYCGSYKTIKVRQCFLPFCYSSKGRRFNVHTTSFQCLHSYFFVSLSKPNLGRTTQDILLPDLLSESRCNVENNLIVSSSADVLRPSFAFT